MCDRSGGRRLRQWLIEQIDSGHYPGLIWENDIKSLFRIPWKHAGKQDYNQEVDASIFKAWAIFKGKFKEGDRAEPATWKTRLRCALNKSPDFEEVTERSQLDISEPYKVYRIVPEEEQKCKIAGSNLSELTEMDCSPSEMETSTEDFLANIKRSPSPAKDTCHKPASHDWWMYPHNAGLSQRQEVISLYVSSAGFSQMIIQFYYGGKAVSQVTTTCAEGCRLSLRPPTTSEKYYPLESFENIQFPPAEYIMSERQRQITKKLFGHLERGVLLLSNRQGIFIKRLCQGRVFWAGNCMPYKDRPNKLERDEITKIFDSNQYIRDFQHCYSNQLRLPDSKVTLCFGEEFPDATPVHSKLIIVQVEQLGLRQLLESSTKNYNLAGLHLAPDSHMDSVQRHHPDPCTTHQRAFYRDTPQITV
uniref:IRF tryptophan pentad repeat domain-containing protein n=1 Tax=Pyxicephalus adspersus TaxID=30357 RepID=A0AAV2ZXB6_PYXAD|nr:TPA: hypothetical protein GDO54_002297 [Pyxicephalus adspersus]